MTSHMTKPVGLIPAAGKGVRLGLPYPKELYPIIRDNRYTPVAQFVLDSLVASGVEDIVIVINETKAQLLGYFGDGHRFGCHIAYSVQEPSRDHVQSTSPGLAQALDAAYHLVRGRPVFFGMADTIIEPIDVFSRAWAAAAPDDDVVLAVFPTERPEKFGMVDYDSSGRVHRIVDKPASTTLTHMWGCIMWRERFTEHLHLCLHERGIADFARILNEAITDGLRVRAIEAPAGSFRDLGTYEEISELDALSRRV